jgi:hypothetical protein
MDIISARLQYMLDATMGHVVYGPLKARYDSAKCAIVGRPNWAVNRWPAVDKLEQWGGPDKMDDWPLAASCSPFASWVMAGYLGLASEFDPRWGRSTYRMLHDPVVESHVQWVAKGRRRFHWGDLPTITWPLFSWRTRGHTGLGINGDLCQVYRPVTGERMRGIWVWVADGTLHDEDTRIKRWTSERRFYWRTIVRRIFCGRPLVLEPADVRAERIRRRVAGYKWRKSRERAERRLRLGIAGLVPPATLGAEDWRCIVPVDGHGDTIRVTPTRWQPQIIGVCKGAPEKEVTDG